MYNILNKTARPARGAETICRKELKMKKTAALLLLIIMTLPLLFACGKAPDGDVSPQGSEQEQTSSEPEKVYTVEKTDLGNREFRIMCWHFGHNSSSILGFTGEVLYNEEQPDSIDEAKKRVVETVEEKFNCRITGNLVHDRGLPTTVRNQAESGLVEYDIFFDSISSTTGLASDGLLTDLNSISTIDLSAPWWDQNAVKDLSIANKLYFVAGDINTYDNQGTWCMLFNKTLKNKLGIEENFYELVREDKWNFDKFMEICSRPGITAETNGDGVLDEKDQWAFGTESYNMYVHLVAGGIKIAGKDADDLPYLTVAKDPEATYTQLAKILDFYNKHDIVMVANFSNYTNKGFPNVWEATVHKSFIEGRELFYMCGLINAASFRVMEDEFGILPVPLLYDSQDEYHHTVSMHNSTVMYIPQGVENIEQVGTVISALSEESRKYVTPAYYDVQLKYRDTRDNESGEMLDLIFSTRTFDVGAAYNWGSILGQYMMEDSNVASRFEAMIGSAQSKLEETVQAIEEMGV